MTINRMMPMMIMIAMMTMVTLTMMTNHDDDNDDDDDGDDDDDDDDDDDGVNADDNDDRGNADDYGYGDGDNDDGPLLYPRSGTFGPPGVMGESQAPKGPPPRVVGTCCRGTLGFAPHRRSPPLSPCVSSPCVVCCVLGVGARMRVCVCVVGLVLVEMEEEFGGKESWGCGGTTCEDRINSTNVKPTVFPNNC